MYERGTLTGGNACMIVSCQAMSGELPAVKDLIVKAKEICGSGILGKQDRSAQWQLGRPLEYFAFSLTGFERIMCTIICLRTPQRTKSLIIILPFTVM